MKDFNNDLYKSKYVSQQHNLWLTDEEAQVGIEPNYKNCSIILREYFLTSKQDVSNIFFFFAGSDGTRFVYPPDALTDNSERHKQFSPSTVPRTIMVHKSTQTEGTPSSSLVQSSLLCPSGPPLTPCPSPVPQRKRACANRTPTTLNPTEDNQPTYQALQKVIGVSAGFLKNSSIQSVLFTTYQGVYFKIHEKQFSYAAGSEVRS